MRVLTWHPRFESYYGSFPEKGVPNIDSKILSSLLSGPPKRVPLILGNPLISLGLCLITPALCELGSVAGYHGRIGSKRVCAGYVSYSLNSLKGDFIGESYRGFSGGCEESRLWLM